MEAPFAIYTPPNSCLLLHLTIQTIHNESKNISTKNTIIRNQLYKSSKTSIPNHLFKSISSRSNPFVNPLFSRKIHVTTRSNPQLNTYTVPIKKRQRGPNKKRVENMTTPTNTIATQTEETSNLGQGRQPLAEKEH